MQVTLLQDTVGQLQHAVGHAAADVAQIKADFSQHAQSVAVAAAPKPQGAQRRQSGGARAALNANPGDAQAAAAADVKVEEPMLQTPPRTREATRQATARQKRARGQDEQA